MRHVRIYLYYLIALIMVVPLSDVANASQTQDNPVDEEVVINEIRAPGDKEGIIAEIVIPAPVEVVWEVMTDYEKLSDFIPDMYMSKIIEKKDSEIILHQQGASRFLLFDFSVEVIIRLEEHNYHNIGFSLIAGDFEYFEGEWNIRPVGDNVTIVIYRLIAHPNFYAPKWVVRHMLKRDVPVRLKALRNRVLQIMKDKL